MLYALTDGLAGIEDLGRGFDEVRLSPRWPAARVEHAEVMLKYESSGTWLSYDYRLCSRVINMDVNCPATVARFHVLLPSGVQAETVRVAGRETAYETPQIRASKYVDFTANMSGATDVTIGFS
jgi:hypothetical protein